MDSLNALYAAVREERTAQRVHFDSLDAKAGVVLGFAGTLIALSTSASQWCRASSIPFLALAAALAVAGFFPRPLPVIEVAALRKYLRAEEPFTLLTLFDTESAMVQEGAALLEKKARLVKWSVVLLGVGAITLAVGVIVGGGHG